MKKQLLLTILAVGASAQLSAVSVTPSDITNLYTMVKQEVEKNLPVLQQFVSLLEQNQVTQARQLLESKASSFNFAPVVKLAADNVDNAKKVLNHFVARIPNQAPFTDAVDFVKGQIEANQGLLNTIRDKAMSLSSSDLDFALQRARDLGTAIIALKDNHPNEYKAFVNQLKSGVALLQSNADRLKAIGQTGLNKINNLIVYVQDVSAGRVPQGEDPIIDAIDGFNSLRDLLPMVFAAIKNGMAVALTLNGQIGQVAQEVGYPAAAPVVMRALQEISNAAVKAENFVNNQLNTIIGE